MTALDEILNVRGTQQPVSDELQIIGKDPVLNSNFKLGEVAAAAHAGVGVAINDLWELKTGQRQKIKLNVRSAAATLKSNKFIKIQNATGAYEDLIDTEHEYNRQLNGVYRTKDGRWFLPHFGVNQLRERMLGLLQAHPDNVVRGEVGGYGYAIFALCLPLALTTVPLLGELAPLLRADPASEWVGALPVTPRDLRLSRVVPLLLIMGALAAASLVPAALLAPDTLRLAVRPLPVAIGFLQTWTVAAGLLLLQVALGRGGDTFMVAVQTLLFVAIMIRGRLWSGFLRDFIGEAGGRLEMGVRGAEPPNKVARKTNCLGGLQKGSLVISCPCTLPV